LDYFNNKKNKLDSPLGKRILSKNIYILKKQFTSTHRSRSADRECIRPHSSALKARGGKPHGRFPGIIFLTRCSPFSFTTLPEKTKRRKNARSATQKTHATQ
ncbi:MAG: hypothetical protein IJC63_07595, partial [Myxococcaceae bacterium]|nr:hypothetical protein [Myxococcaceae bacterium]